MEKGKSVVYLALFCVIFICANGIHFEDGELCLVKRNFSVATCGLKPEVEDVKHVLKKMENQISYLKTELNEVKDQCGRHVHQEARSCADNLQLGGKSDGLYYVDPDGNGKFKVFCDMTTSGGGWAVFQRRLDGSVDFLRGWQDYKKGFGSLYAEHWLGLDKIHRITASEAYELRIELEDFSGEKRYATYRNFSVGSEASKYKLTVGSYSGTIGDSFRYHNGMSFSTKDSDNDLYAGNCASRYTGAWWYNACHTTNLNGAYYHGGVKTPYAKGIVWNAWKGHYYSLKTVTMKVRVI